MSDRQQEQEKEGEPGASTKESQKKAPPAQQWGQREEVGQEIASGGKSNEKKPSGEKS